MNLYLDVVGSLVRSAQRGGFLGFFVVFVAALLTIGVIAKIVAVAYDPIFVFQFLMMLLYLPAAVIALFTEKRK